MKNIQNIILTNIHHHFKYDHHSNIAHQVFNVVVKGIYPKFRINLVHWLWIRCTLVKFLLINFFSNNGSLTFLHVFFVLLINLRIMLLTYIYMFLTILSIWMFLLFRLFKLRLWRVRKKAFKCFKNLLFLKHYFMSRTFFHLISSQTFRSLYFIISHKCIHNILKLWS